MNPSSTPASKTEWQAALDHCAADPIHLIGQVQAGVVLLSVQIEEDRFVHLSPTAAELLGKPLEELWRTPAAELLGRQQLDLLLRRALSWRGRGPRLIEIEYPGGGLIASWIHVRGDFLVIETTLDPIDLDGTVLDADDWDDAMRTSLSRIEACRTLEDKLAAVAAETRRQGAFDRVMIYRFLPDGTGEVVAEEVREDWEPYLHLRYPASDIPPQARALFLHNDLRLIRDTASVPVPVLAAPVTATPAPLDLSLARYRQPAAIHVDYLKNMGVTASFVTAVVVDGELWGLISCHHGQPLRLPAVRQAQLGALTHHLAIDLTAMAREVQLRQELACSRLANKLIQCVTLTEDWTTVLLSMAPELCELMNAEGMSLRFQDRYRSHGLTPEEAILAALSRDARRQGEGRPLACSHAADHPLDPPLPASIGGFLAIPLSHFCDDALLLFRREQTRKVVWAGVPEKTVDRSEGVARLRPRASFAAWQQTVAGSSDDWTASEISLAETIGNTLSDIVITAHYFRQWMESPAAARHRLAHEGHTDPVALADEHGIVVYQNSAALREPLLAAAASFDRLIPELPGLEADAATAAIRALAQEGTPLLHELDPGPDGRPRQLEASRLTDEEGRVIGYCVRISQR